MATVPLELMPTIRGVVLKQTMLLGIYVLVIVAVVATATAAAMSRRAFPLVRRLVPWLAGAVLVGAAAMTAVRPATMALWCKEGHALEWLASAVLLAAWVVALATVFRPARADSPRPLAAFMSAGLFVALARELQFGEPFLGEKVVNSRYFFRPAAWFDPSRFAKVSQATGVSAESLRLIHVLCGAALLVVLGTVAVYLVARRRAFADQLRRFVRSAAGAYFLVGLGLYVGTQVLGRSVEKWVSAAAPDWTAAASFSNSVIDEPVELVAAMCLAMSVLKLWHGELAATGPTLPSGRSPQS